MPHYLLQVAYSREGWQALLAQPQDRIEAVRPAIEKLGGKITSAWFAFGEYDVVVIAEMPDTSIIESIDTFSIFMRLHIFKHHRLIGSNLFGKVEGNRQCITHFVTFQFFIRFKATV